MKNDRPPKSMKPKSPKQPKNTATKLAIVKEALVLCVRLVELALKQWS